jgi:glycolate oxidase
VVRICHAAGIPFVARGAGTGLSGGALPVAEGVVISLARLNRILEIDLDAGQIVVEPGVTNLDVTRAVSGDGFYYAPDPSSQQVCTIGGNIAENSGGAHCLKHGFTVNHVLAADVVLPDGELVTLSVWDEGPDLLGLFVGSEGTLGIATRLVLRVLRAPSAVRTLLAGFEHTDAAGAAVSATIGAGILPAAIEMMDAVTMEAAEAAVGANYPDGCGAVLIVELDGPAEQVEQDLAAVERLCREQGAAEVRIASDPADRAAVWRGRKAAFAAMGRVSPNSYVQDGVVPRTRLPQVLRRIDELTVRQDELRREHVVDREAVLEAVRAAGVLRDVAADRAHLLRRRVGRVVEAGVGDRARDVEVGDPRLDDDLAALDVEDALGAKHGHGLFGHAVFS